MHKLGEDMEISLKQLAFGTVRRSLRTQVAEEMKRYGYVGPYEWKMLDRISLIEVSVIYIVMSSFHPLVVAAVNLLWLCFRFVVIVL